MERVLPFRLWIRRLFFKHSSSSYRLWFEAGDNLQQTIRGNQTNDNGTKLLTFEPNHTIPVYLWWRPDDALQSDFGGRWYFRGIYTLSGEVTVILVSLLSKGMQRERHILCLPCQRWQEIYLVNIFSLTVWSVLTHFRLNRLPHTIYWKRPISI